MSSWPNCVNTDNVTTVADSSRPALFARHWPRVFILASAATFVTAVATTLYFGSISTALAWCRGQALAIGHNSRDVGAIPAGARTTEIFTIRSLRSGPVRVIGADVSCGCLRVENRFPIIINPDRDVELKCVLRPYSVNAGKAFQQTVLLYVDVPSAPIVLSISGSIEP